MAKLPLFKRNPGTNQHAQFPADYLHVADALVDDHLLPQLQAMPPRCWNMQVNPTVSYARFKTTVAGKTGTHPLHRVVWELVHGVVPPGLQIDHVDGNGLRNVLANLRPSTSLQNKYNSRKQRTMNGVPTTSLLYKGVHRDTSQFRNKPWESQIKPPGARKISLGYWASELEAAYAYHRASSLLFGVYAYATPIPPGSLTPEQELRIEVLVRSKLGLVTTP